ncbi:helix-turn-helix domain-containing protein [Deminuibacter soli]|nr:helix-turn-helix domain-containing protein [Deminuibacter soli]
MKPFEIIQRGAKRRSEPGLPFRIQKLQLNEFDATQDEDYFIADQYVIVWIQQGEGTCWMDMKQMDYRRDAVFCIKPGVSFKIKCTQPTEGMLSWFSSAFLGIADQEADSYYRACLTQMFDSTQPVIVGAEAAADMAEIAARLLREFDSSGLFRAELLSRYLKVFLVYLTRQYDYVYQEQVSKTTELVKRFMVMLDKSFQEKKMVLDYARQLSVTPNYLNEMVRKSTGFTASYHIRQRVILEAKRLASYSDACTKQISYSLGFKDTAHFSKFFKSNAGITFSCFKRGLHV